MYVHIYIHTLHYITAYECTMASSSGIGSFSPGLLRLCAGNGKLCTPERSNLALYVNSSSSLTGPHLPLGMQRGCGLPWGRRAPANRRNSTPRRGRCVVAIITSILISTFLFLFLDFNLLRRTRRRGGRGKKGWTPLFSFGFHCFFALGYCPCLLLETGFSRFVRIPA